MVIQMRNGGSERALRDLCNYIKALPTYNKDLPFVEIGCYTGESTVIFAQNLENPIYCVDPWKSGYDPLDPASNSDFVEVKRLFEERTKGYNITHFYELDPIECVAIYLDGDHSYEGVKKDLLKWKAPIISGHDFIEDPVHQHVYGVQKAVREILGEPDIIFEDSSWLKTIKMYSETNNV